MKFLCFHPEHLAIDLCLSDGFTSIETSAIETPIHESMRFNEAHRWGTTAWIHGKTCKKLRDLVLKIEGGGATFWVKKHHHFWWKRNKEQKLTSNFIMEFSYLTFLNAFELAFQGGQPKTVDETSGKVRVVVEAETWLVHDGIYHGPWHQVSRPLH